MSTGEFLTTEGDVEHIDKLLQNFQPSEILIPKQSKTDFTKHFGTHHHTFFLEDWAFKYLSPEEFRWLNNLSMNLYAQREQSLQRIRVDVRKLLTEMNIEVISIFKSLLILNIVKKLGQ